MTDLPLHANEDVVFLLTVKSTSQKMKCKLRAGSEHELVQRMEES
jgi:hypothetical protein